MEKKRLKMLVVDIWAEQGTNLHRYAAGLAAGASEYADVTVAVPYSFVRPEGHRYRVIHTFFPFSSKISGEGFVRRVIRGVEYVTGYLRIAHIAKREGFDVVQVEWPLRYRLDAKLYRHLKKGCRLFVYKAHNVLPHSSGDRFIEDMRVIYGIADKILIHGRSVIEREFVDLFPEYKDKLIVQRHGINEARDLSFDEGSIDPDMVSRIHAAHENGGKVYFIVGDIHEDKGIDRLIRVWLDTFSKSSSVLIVRGRQLGSYPDLEALEPRIKESENIIFRRGYVYNNEVNYLMTECDLVVLPYRKAYMSGVFFTCVEFGRAFLATDWGVVAEYTDNGKDSFIVENSEEAFRDKLLDIDRNESREHLAEMGASLKEHYEREYNWKKIEHDVIGQYEKCLQETGRRDH